MTTDLVRYQATSSLDVAPQAWKIAEKIANTEMVPTALRGRPEAVLAIMLAGHEAGIQPMQSLQKIHIIEGRPAMAAELMRALVLQHGHELIYEEVTITRCKAAGRRRGSERWTTVTWTMDDAKRGGLDRKANWVKWPRAMLIARSTAELCRMIFPDVLAGISYTVEELEDGDTLDLGPIEVREALTSGGAEEPRRTARAAKAITKPSMSTEPEPASPAPRGDVPALPGEDDESPVTDAEVIDSGPSNEGGKPVSPQVTETTGQAQDSDSEQDWPAGEWPSGDFPSDPTPEQQRRYTGPQLIAIRLAARFDIKGNSADARAQRIAAISALLGRPVASSKDLTSAEIQTVIERLDVLPEGAPLTDLVPAPAERVETGPAPEEWPSDQWRKLLADRKVKVPEAMIEAHRLGALADPPVKIATLDDVAGSGVAVALLGFVEDLALSRGSK